MNNSVMLSEIDEVVNKVNDKVNSSDVNVVINDLLKYLDKNFSKDKMEFNKDSSQREILLRVDDVKKLLEYATLYKEIISNNEKKRM